MQAVTAFEIAFAIYFLNMALYLMDFMGDTVKCTRCHALISLGLLVTGFIFLMVIISSFTGVSILLELKYGET